MKITETQTRTLMDIVETEQTKQRAEKLPEFQRTGVGSKTLKVNVWLKTGDCDNTSDWKLPLKASAPLTWS